MAMSSDLFDWVAASWGPSPPSRDGALLACDFQYTIRSERGFVAALISETAFPSLDAAAKTPGYLGLRLTPRSVLPGINPNAKLNMGTGVKQKLWLTSNFRLDVDGLDASKVSRIAPFVVRRMWKSCPPAGPRPSRPAGWTSPRCGSRCRCRARTRGSTGSRTSSSTATTDPPLNAAAPSLCSPRSGRRARPGRSPRPGDLPADHRQGR